MVFGMVAKVAPIEGIENGGVLELPSVLRVVVKESSGDLRIPCLSVIVLVTNGHNQETRVVFDAGMTSETLLEFLGLLIYFSRAREAMVSSRVTELAC